MQILVVSDTHGRSEYLEQLLETEDARNSDWLIHCGDIGYDDEWLRMTFRGAVTIVAGNCDYGSDLPLEATVERENHGFYITHGHRYLMGGIDRLLYRAEELGCDVVLFGHTHRPYIEQDGDILACNPGSLAMPRQSDGRHTYAVLEVTEDGVTARIAEL
ncbi:MAG: metallophosphoesterase [Lachnospiraceae bacterium]|nr:metallophosphoesterase [Lachnospiraceae bacterium]